MMHSFPLLLNYLATYGYVALLLIVFMGGTYLPVPAGLFVIAAGAFSRAGYFNIYLSFLATVLGSISASVLHFIIARKFEKKDYFQKYVERHPYAKKLQEHMRNYPKRTIFLSRFIGFASMPVNILAGLSKIPLHTFLIADVFANMLTATIYLSIGYVVGIAATQGTHWQTLIGWVLTGLAIFYTLIFFIWKRFNKAKSS